MDRKAYIDALHRTYFPLLWKYALRQTGEDEWRAEDLVQETFTLALLHYETLREHANPGGYLFKTLQRLIWAEREKERRRAEVPLDAAEDGPYIGAEEQYSRLEDMLPRGLSERDRELLVLRYERELSCAEIAEMRGVSAEAVWQQASRAVKRCRKLLEEQKGKG